MPDIVIPYAPRVWAKRLHASLLRWVVLVMHRRKGKTTTILNHHQRYALDDNLEKKRLNFLNPAFSVRELQQLCKRRVYWNVMPTSHQARLAGAWDTLKEISRPIPGIKPNETFMSVRYPNGSTVQLVGAADPDALRGPALSGLSLDEYSQIPENAFGEVLSKALADHLGYCIFSGTIKGKDHLWRLYQAVQTDTNWLAMWEDIDVSLATETGATITALRTALEDDRKLVAQGVMSQSEFDQEWYLSVDAAIKGSYYGDIIGRLRKTGHLTRVPYDPSLPVDTDWDLGIDAMAVWFSQRTAFDVRLIDYHEDIGGGLELALRALRGQTPNPGNDAKIAQANARRAHYRYGEHWAPHDIETREITTAKTRRQAAKELGIHFRVTPKLAVDDGITAAQFLLDKCYFDEQNCASGIDALTHYRKQWNQRLEQFMPTPVHDQYSHGADAFRGLAVRYRPVVTQPEPKPVIPADVYVSGQRDRWML